MVQIINNMLQLTNKFFSQVDNVLGKVFANTYASTAIVAFLIVYASMAVPNLPPVVAMLFDNPLFKLLVLTSILVVFNYDPVAALLTAVAFTLSLQALNRYKMYGFAMGLNHMFGDEEAKGEVEGDVEGREVVQDDASAPSGVSSPFLNTAGCAPADVVGMPQIDEVSLETKPQPQEVDQVQPPQQEGQQEVSGVGQGCQYQGPQGLQHPTGYSGRETGASYASCESEL